MKFKKSVKNAKREKGEFISSLMKDKLRGLDSSERDCIGDKKSGARQVCKSSPARDTSRIIVTATNTNGKIMGVLITKVNKNG